MHALLHDEVLVLGGEVLPEEVLLFESVCGCVGVLLKKREEGGRDTTTGSKLFIHQHTPTPPDTSTH
jgi:hypothetical protein